MQGLSHVLEINFFVDETEDNVLFVSRLNIRIFVNTKSPQGTNHFTFTWTCLVLENLIGRQTIFAGVEPCTDA